MHFRRGARPTAVVLRPLGLGDLLTGVPAIRAVRAAVPGHRLVLATTAALAPLAGLVDAVDEVLAARELEPLDWDRPPPELAVDLHGKGPASHVVAAGLHPRRLLTFASPGWPGPVWYPDEHEVRRWCRLVSEGLGVDADPDALDVAVPAVPPPVTGAALVHPGAAFPGRRWPAERFAAVARELAAAGHDVRAEAGTGRRAGQPRRRHHVVHDAAVREQPGRGARRGEQQRPAGQEPAQAAQGRDRRQRVPQAQRPQHEDGPPVHAAAHGQELSVETATTSSRTSHRAGWPRANRIASATWVGSLRTASGPGLYWSGRPSKKAVVIPPGTRSVTPTSPAVSAASARVKPTTPNFDAQ